MHKYSYSFSFNRIFRELPSGLVVGLHAFTAEYLGSLLGQRTKILQATWCGQKKKKRNIFAKLLIVVWFV